jgi:hypothetical protein
MQGADSIISGDASGRHDHVNANVENIHDQLDQFELSLNTELRDLEKLVDELGVGRSRLNDDSESDPDEVIDGHAFFDWIDESQSVQSQTPTNTPQSTAVARPRAERTKWNTLERPPPKSSLEATSEIIGNSGHKSSGKRYGVEQKAPETMSDTSPPFNDAHHTPDQKHTITYSHGEMNKRYSQRKKNNERRDRESQNNDECIDSVEPTEKSPGRKIGKPRTPSVEGRGRGDVWRHVVSQESQCKREEKSLNSLPFHLRN